MTSAVNGMSDTLDFEGAFGSLQESIGQLERGGLSLEAAILTFERGIALVNRCALPNLPLRAGALAHSMPDVVTHVANRSPVELVATSGSVP